MVPRSLRRLPSPIVPRVLIASDAPWVIDEVRSVIVAPDVEVVEIHTGAAVRQAVADDPPDLVILDLQIGNMGGMAVCLDLRLEEGGDRLPHVPVLMLLDRRADVFLARRSDAEGWLVKPLDPIRLGKAVRILLGGGTYHDDAFKPQPVLVAPREP
jgi:DNA-binding response OmpR family regulator